ncbi:WGxxGxxG family protein [Paenibacillus sp. NPDC056933]|uniref:WGxxGxxG family protein n=1 Tax=Paenibacillus sp. NPDC056933 TaxID=3345968 RepID=UPI00363F8D32
MKKKSTTFIASMLLVAALAGPAAAQGHTTKGMEPNATHMSTYDNSNYTNGDYRTNNVRTNAATTDRNKGMDWGWLGLLGLLGLAGMRRKVTDHNDR